MTRLYSTFRHHEAEYPTVASVADSFAGPPFSQFLRRPVLQTITTSGDCTMGGNGGSEREDLEELLRRILTSMVRLRSFDETFKAAQRQGKISFFLESRGEEAAVVASAAALEPQDDIFSQYREHGALLWRGASFEALAHQCCGSREDSAKGRQMPMHFGDRSKKFHTVSSPLATQLLHGVGFAYAKKMSREDGIVACYFGDGTSSEGDFHAALNFASTLRCPMVFICRNNGYAISTPTSQQFVGDGVASRAEGYGMCSCRVDGGDARAVYLATRAARKLALSEGRPVLLELMTYRLGDHSTSDDHRNYVPESILLRGEQWGDPIRRLGAFLSECDADLARVREDAVREARLAVETARCAPRPEAVTMFDDVYDCVEGHELSRQRRELLKSSEGKGSNRRM
jgi:2-oxoisovalerate dehydrogenase E1 component alpha subunit